MTLPHLLYQVYHSLFEHNVANRQNIPTVDTPMWSIFLPDIRLGQLCTTDANTTEDVHPSSITCNTTAHLPGTTLQNEVRLQAILTILPSENNVQVDMVYGVHQP